MTMRVITNSHSSRILYRMALLAILAALLAGIGSGAIGRGTAEGLRYTTVGGGCPDQSGGGRTMFPH